jgi:tetratricopeptide (TPR) repeat protein
MVTIGWSSLNLLPLAGLDGRLALDSLVTVVLGRPAPGVGRMVSAFLLVALLLATALAGQYMATFLVGFIALATGLPLGALGRWLGATGGPVEGPARLLQGRAAEALAWADGRLERHPEDMDATLIRAEALRSLTRWPEALATYEVILGRRPSSWPALAGRSVARRALGQLEDARRDQAALVAAAASDQDAVAPAAIALWSDHRYTEAARLLDDPLASSAVAGPLRGALGALRAAIHSALGESELALAVSDERLADAPEDIGAHEVRAHALLQLGRLREARASARSALAGAPSHPELLETMAIIARISGDAEEALPLLIDAGAARPNLPRARAELAACFVQLGRLDEAASALDGLDPVGATDPHVSYAHACMLARAGQVAEAAAALGSAAAVRPALARIAEHDPLLRERSVSPADGSPSLVVSVLAE